MLILKTEIFTLTFFTYVLLGSTFVEALSHTAPAVSRREHHIDLKKRFVKKRSPFPQKNKEDFGFDEVPVAGVGKAPETDTVSTTTDPASTSSSTSSSSSSVSESSSSSVSESSSTVSSASSSSSSVAPSSTEPVPASTPTPPPTTPTTSHATVVVFSTADNAPSEPANVNNGPTGAASSSKSTILTALIAVAASIGGIVILWTVFRKWKLGRSKEFDQRLQPIDWQPTTGDGDDIIPPNRRHSGASSFRSATGPRSYGAASEVEYRQGALQPLPDHDFTATPNLAPVGGYADLSRGPSPQPQMSERSGNSGMSSYDASIPLHHQGYGSEDAYNGGRY